MIEKGLARKAALHAFTKCQADIKDSASFGICLGDALAAGLRAADNELETIKARLAEIEAHLTEPEK
jgi:hypothetical protein|tara:strand:- start:287 stop:487 length:201 start_codon:yes stop_codon:yes gene_type:complete